MAETTGRRGPGRGRRPVLITDAPPSVAQEIRYREIRYVIMMGIRALCLIVATVLVTSHVRYLGIWVPVLIASALVLPWLAVILANDRRPRRAGYPSRVGGGVPTKALSNDGDQDDHPIIDVDP
jgi:Protein of unknown function (DUF3099)